MRNSIILICLLLFAALTFALARAAEKAVEAYAAAQVRPYSALEAIMTSRQTPPVTTAGSAAGSAGVLAVVLVLIVAAVLVLRTGGEFLRQWRLLRRRGRRPTPYNLQRTVGTPTTPPAPDADLPILPPVRRAPRVPEAAWIESEAEWSDGVRE